jgi:hypothetical protein
MLKPLFGKTLKMGTSYATNSRAGFGSRPGPLPTSRGYQLNDPDDLEMTKYSTSDNNGFQSTVVKGGVSDDGSETFILPDIPRDAVVMKTEISVVKTDR